MPLIVMAFIKPTYRVVLVEEGYVDANGAEQAVPGFAIMFAFFLVGAVSFSFFREHGWNTWERLRASSTTSAEVMAGKVIVPLAVSLSQLAVLFVVGGLLFDLNVRGSILGIVLLCIALGICLVALGLALTSLCRTITQVDAASNLGAILMAGLGGALAPISSLPDWARAVAPVTPSYWAMRGFQSVILFNHGVSSVILPVIVLLVFGSVFTLVAAARFRFEQTKVSWA